MIYTPEEMALKLQRLSARSIPAMEKGMLKACQNVEGKAKEDCTPGNQKISPLAKGLSLFNLTSPVGRADKYNYWISSLPVMITNWPLDQDWPVRFSTINL